MKDTIKNKVNEALLKESSLSRIYQHMLKCDTAIITAFRKTNTREVNEKLNIELKAILLKKGYGITAVKGTYIEGYNSAIAKEVKEDSLFVVNLSDDTAFNASLAQLGNKYDQDCVIFIQKGGKESYLLGTNETGFPGFKQVVQQGAFKPKSEGEFMTRHQGAPFTLGEGLDTYEGLSGLSRRAVTGIAEGKLKK
jgi:hypothetical protein